VTAKLVNATLYQSDAVLAERVDTERLGLYIMELADATYEVMRGVNQPEMLDVVVLVRPAADVDPGDHLRLWVLSDLDDEPSYTPDRAGLLDGIRSVTVPALTGPIAFAITFSVAGALPPAEHQPPAPGEWRVAAASLGEEATPTIPDDLIPALWRSD
jgi:hypothetical protein